VNISPLDGRRQHGGGGVDAKCTQTHKIVEKGRCLVAVEEPSVLIYHH